MMNKLKGKGPAEWVDGRPFYRIYQEGDGLVDIWLTPGKPVPMHIEGGLIDYNIRVKAVQGIDPNDPQWGGDLEEHIRRNYSKWLESAEEIEI